MKTKATVLATCEVECFDGMSTMSRRRFETVHAPSGPITREWTEQETGWWSPCAYRPRQPKRIPVWRNHDRTQRIGEVVYLRWGTGPDRIFAVIEIAQDTAVELMASGRDSYISPGCRSATSRDGARHDDIELDHLGLVAATARIAATSVKWAATSFDERYSWTQETPGVGLLVAAYEARRKRSGEGILIVGHPALEEERLAAERYAGDGELMTTVSGAAAWQARNGMDRTSSGHEMHYSSPAGSCVLRVW